MKNLLEELNRIKVLMVYEKGAPINEVSTTSRNNSQKEPKQSSGEGDKEPKQSSGEGDNSFYVKASGEFEVDVNKDSKAVTNFIKNLENSIKNNPKFDKTKVKDGSMYITEIKLRGFASNFNGGVIEPDFDNDWCKKWDHRGGLYDGLCSEWTINNYSGEKIVNKGRKTKNNELAQQRAENAYKALKDELISKAEEEGIKIDPNLEPIYEKGGTIYTNNVVDENNKTKIKNGQINPGQVVLCTVKVSYELKDLECEGCKVPKDGKCVCPEEKGLKEGEDGKCICIKTNEPPNENCECAEERGCPKCQEKDENGNCKCKEGLKEVDGKCVCEDGSEPDEDCKCKKKEECPDLCMKRNEEDKCECPSDMKYDEEKKECVCKDENKVKVPGGCKCENKKPSLKCDYNIEKKGVRGTKENNYVGASLQTSFPAGANDSITIDFDSVVVPDAFYVKYGDQEYWSGFMGSVTNDKYTQVALSIEDRKLMLPIQTTYIKDSIKKSLDSGDNDYSQMIRVRRNFVGELVMYKRNRDLIGGINNAISGVGGKLKVDSLFKNGDGNAESITDNIIKTGSIKDNIGKYEGIMKSNVSFTIDKQEEKYPLTVLVFSPLDRTIFTMKVKCQ